LARTIRYYGGREREIYHSSEGRGKAKKSRGFWAEKNEKRVGGDPIGWLRRRRGCRQDPGQNEIVPEELGSWEVGGRGGNKDGWGGE